MSEHHKHCTHSEINEHSIKLLIVSFIINILLSLAEIIGGIIAGSVALIGDALHNTSDAFSILIAVVAYKISHKKASEKYTYGFKRAETIGAFVNLILLFISGCYLFIEGILHLIKPISIDGYIIIYISVLALIIDVATAKISHHGAHHNANMKMLFIHNLADAFGSIGVIVSGLFIIYFDVYRIDGVIALIIASYMIFQSFLSFPKIVNILMNAAPNHLNIDDIKKEIMGIRGVKGIHHIHLWSINEDDVALECHVESCDLELSSEISVRLSEKFHISHCNIQVEKSSCCVPCQL